MLTLKQSHGGKYMKYILLFLSLFLLFGCQEKEPESLSSEVKIQSLNTSKVLVEGNMVYITEGMIQSEFIALIEPIDNSHQSYQFFTNDNQIKTRTELFEYEKLEVTSEDGKYKEIYTIYYFPQG